MSTIATPLPARTAVRSDPVAQAYLIMRIAFTVAPILFGLDKFANVLTDDWTRYLATQFNDIIPGSAAQAMHLVGIVEIVAGLVVAVRPREGALLVAAWLGGVIVNLLLVGGYGDIALRHLRLPLRAPALPVRRWCGAARPPSPSPGSPPGVLTALAAPDRIPGLPGDEDSRRWL